MENEPMSLLDSIVQNMQAERPLPVKPPRIVQKFSLPTLAPIVTKRRSTCRWIVRVNGQVKEMGWRERGWRQRVRDLRALLLASGASPTIAVNRYTGRYRAVSK